MRATKFPIQRNIQIMSGDPSTRPKKYTMIKWKVIQQKPYTTDKRSKLYFLLLSCVKSAVI